MKDRRPSRLFEIRYFGPTRDRYLDGLDDVVAYGRRMAFYLNGEGLSLGAYEALYICFASDLKPGAVRVADDSSEWWFRYADVGVPDDFFSRSDAAQIAVEGTVAALKHVRADAATAIDRAD